jgi:hypothetical protein
MVGEPNELPEGGEGGGRGGVFPGRGPNPAELPIDFVSRGRVNTALLTEVVRLRNRLHNFETQQLIGSVLGRAATVIGGPNELPPPEIDEGGGFGGGVIPPIPEINEIPIDRFARDLTARMARLENLIAGLARQIEGLKR